MHNRAFRCSVHFMLTSCLFSVSTGIRRREKTAPRQRAKLHDWLPFFFCRFFDFTTIMTFPLRTEGLVLRSNLSVKQSTEDTKDSNSLSNSDYKETPTLHQSIKHNHVHFERKDDQNHSDQYICRHQAIMLTCSSD